MFWITIRHALKNYAWAEEIFIFILIFLLTSPFPSVTQKLLLVRRSVADKTARKPIRG